MVLRPFMSGCIQIRWQFWRQETKQRGSIFLSPCQILCGFWRRMGPDFFFDAAAAAAALRWPSHLSAHPASPEAAAAAAEEATTAHAARISLWAAAAADSAAAATGT